MSKKLAVAVLGMSVVVAGVAWKRTLENSLPGHTLSATMTAQGGDPGVALAVVVPIGVLYRQPS